MKTKELIVIRKDLMYANENNDKILIGFAINKLDTFIYKQQLFTYRKKEKKKKINIKECFKSFIRAQHLSREWEIYYEEYQMNIK